MAPFGEANPKLLIVGLAPGMHGANRTGRPFTGDYAGILLYESLFALGLVERADVRRSLRWAAAHGARITNAVKCLPPDNKPLPAEIKTCNQYLAAEFAKLTSVKASSRSARWRTTRCSWRLGLKRSAANSATATNTNCPAGAHGRFVSLQPLQHADAPADPRMFQAVLKRAASSRVYN